MNTAIKNSILFIALNCLVMPAFSQNEGDFRTVNDGNWTDISVWERFDGDSWRGSESQPVATDGAIHIQNGHSITLNTHKTLDELTIEGALTVHKTIVLSLSGDITVNGDLTIDGALLCGTHTVRGSGAFFLLAQATLQIGSPFGITLSGNKGNIQTYNRLYSGAANYVYSGFEAQVTGNGLPAPRLDGTLTVDNRDGCSLTRNIIINNQLVLSEGVLCLNGNTLTVNQNKMVWCAEGSLSLCGGTIQGSNSTLQLNSN